MYVSKYANIFIKSSNKKKINENKNLDLIIIVSIIFIIIFISVIMYNNMLKNREKDYNTRQLKDIPKNLQDLPVCHKFRNYRLVDYYISSSFNTASLSNKHFDYVSEDAIRNTLLQGARYIQLNICSIDVNINNRNDEPVIATVLNDKFHITSLNTIKLIDVLTIIKNYAFKVRNHDNFKKINYPLFIDFSLNTNNIYVLNKAVKYIKDILGDYLLDKDKYTKLPIQYEYLCNLLNKIIIFVNKNNIYNSNFNIIEIPKNLLIKKIEVKTINDSILDKDDLHKYLLNISKINLKDIYKNMDFFKLLLKKIIDNPDYINNNQSINKIINIKYNKNGIMNKLDIETKLIFLNSIGMTIITPNINENFIENYDFRLAFNTGCQFMLMSFQNNDKYLKRYKKIFQYNSFVLKAGNIRYQNYEDESVDLLEKYGEIKKNINPINYHIGFYNYTYSVIYIKEIISGDFKYSKIKNNNLLLSNNNTLNKQNYLLLKKVKYNDIDAFYIINPFNQNFCLTIKNNYQNIQNDNLYFNTINKDIEIFQLFIIEKSLYIDDIYYGNDNNIINEFINTEQNINNNRNIQNERNNIDEKNISIRSVINSDEPYYLSVYKNKFVLRIRSSVDKKFLSFNSNVKPAKFNTKLNNVLYGHVKVYSNNIVAIGKKSSNFNIIYKNISNNNREDRVNNYRHIYIKYNDKYVCEVGNNLKLLNQYQCPYILEIKNDVCSIRKGKKYLIADKNGKLFFDEEYKILIPEKRNKKNKIIKYSKRGPGFGSAKYFYFNQLLNI